MRITRKVIKETANFFPSLYTLQDYPHGFEVIKHRWEGEGVCSVFFRKNGGAIRTDIPAKQAKLISLKEGCLALGLIERFRKDEEERA